MDEVFFKSALPAQPHLVDSSLALSSAVASSPSSAAADSRDRSLRVQQQVQLTLARKARKSLSNGSVHLQKSTGKSFDATDGPATLVKVNGFTNGSISGSHTRKPCKRVEVTPPPSPQLPRSRFYNGSYRFGTYTHPGPNLPQRPGPFLDQSFGGFDSSRRYTLSEAPRPLRPHASTSMLGSMRQRSLRQAAAPQPVMACAAFQQQQQQSSQFNSRSSQQQTIVKQERHSVQSKCGTTVIGGAEDGLAWLHHLREGTQGPSQLKSYPPSVVSMEVDMGKQRESPVQLIQTKDVAALKSASKPPEMTLERAVSLLSQENEETLISAAGHIQNQCFKSAEAKKMVYYLRGIGKLLQLLNNGDEEVQRVAAGALRNVVYQSDENKMEVKENDGMADILSVLKSSRDLETRRELTGLLWNLSSHDLLKERLTREGLSILTKSVLVPCSGLSEGENPKDELLADADVFYNATGCLRNLSSAGPDGRKAMRECENLIDSLVYYIRGTIADYKTDDKSTENCACILHNLSYQIEAELPQRYARDLRESRQNLAPKNQPIGCFAYRSANITEQLERRCPLLEEKANPRGIEWLWSAITIRMYLSLIARSVRHQTQEAAIGALQNITAGKGPVTEAISFTIVQKENGLQHIRNMLEEGESDVKRAAISLIRNLSRYPELHPDIVKQVLPDVVEMLPHDDSGTELPSEVTATLCHILTNLSQSDVQNVKAMINRRALPKIIEISSQDNGYGPTKAGQAACVLLQTLWRHNDLHGAYKKFGYRKADFVNARTTKAVNSGRE